MTGTIWRATLALVLIACMTPFQFTGILIAPTLALLLGAVAGWSDAKTRAHPTTEHGMGTGACVGVGALLGSMIGLTVLVIFIAAIPDVQAYVQASDPQIKARIPTDLIAPLVIVCGLIGGFILGLINLILAVLGGMIAVVLYKRSHPIQV